MASTASPKLSAIGALVLTRLLPVSEKGETTLKIRKDLEPFLLHRWFGAALAEQIERALGELEVSGLVTFMRGKTKKSAPKVVSTSDGRRQALAFLGIDELKPKTTWATLRKIHLPAQVLGLSPSSDASIKAIGSDPGFKAILLKQQFHLVAAELPKLDDVLDALAWKLIGFEGSARKFAIKAVKTALFNREIGDGRATEFKKAANQLLARRVGADVTTPRNCVMRSCAAGSTSTPRHNLTLLMHAKAPRPLLLRHKSSSICRPLQNESRLPPALARPAGMGATRFSSRMSGWRFGRTPCFETWALANSRIALPRQIMPGCLI